MQVKELMSCNLRSVHPDTSLQEVSSLMCLYRYSGLPVVEDGKLAGFIAEKDVLHSLFPTIDEYMDGGAKNNDIHNRYKDQMNLKVSDIMIRNVITVSPEQHAMRAAAVMVKNRFRRIPVADGDKLIGMVSLGDIHKAIFHTNVSTH